MADRVTGPKSAEIRIHDPYVDHWYELEEQDTYPSPGSSWKRFFRNQEGLKQTVVEKDLENSMIGAETVILAVPHKQYLYLTRNIWSIGRPTRDGDLTQTKASLKILNDQPEIDVWKELAIIFDWSLKI